MGGGVCVWILGQQQQDHWGKDTQDKLCNYEGQGDWKVWPREREGGNNRSENRCCSRAAFKQLCAWSVQLFSP